MYSIAQAASKVGLAASAIRYYEAQGLLNVVPDRKAGRRTFDADGIAELALLNDLRRAGMTLADIKRFQNLRRDTSAPCSELSALARERATLLRREINALRRAEERLNSFAQACGDTCTSTAHACAIVSTIGQAGG